MLGRMPELAGLKQLAVAYGIEPQWYDIWGHAHEVAEATLRAVLAAMHVQADDDAARAARRYTSARWPTWREPLPAAVVVRESTLPARLVVRFPEDRDADELAWRLLEEKGEQHSAVFVFGTLPELERREVDGQRFVARRLTLDAKPAPGYHRLLLLRGEQVLAETLLIVAPDTCYQPEAVRDDGRTWGPAVQLYAVRSERNWGIGDFTDLRMLLEQWAQHGADVVGLNPLHALFPHNPEHASPYSPSSRLFLQLRSTSIRSASTISAKVKRRASWCARPSFRRGCARCAPPSWWTTVRSPPPNCRCSSCSTRVSASAISR